MAQGKEGLGRALWRAPAPPCHLQSQRQFCLSLSPLTHIPRAGPGPTCPSVLSHRGLDQSVPPAAAQLHLPAAPGGNHLPPEQAGAPEGPGGCPGAGSEPPAPAGEGPGECPGWGGQPHLSQSLQSSIHTSSSQLHIPVHGGSPARGGWCLLSTPRWAQSWGVLAALLGESVQGVVPSQGLCWGRARGDKGQV